MEFKVSRRKFPSSSDLYLDFILGYFQGVSFKNSGIIPSFRVMCRHSLSDLCERNVQFISCIGVCSNSIISKQATNYLYTHTTNLLLIK